MIAQPATASLGADEVSLVEAIGAASMKLDAILSATGKSLDEALPLVKRLVAGGFLSYNLTTGFTLTESMLAEEGTIGHRSVGARMPAQIFAPNMTDMSAKKSAKLKLLAKERERTRDRLRQLAQESGPVRRRSLKTLRDLQD